MTWRPIGVERTYRDDPEPASRRFRYIIRYDGGYTFDTHSAMNTRFAVAVHILTFLHSQDGEPATSELIASSVDTNPSLIRRLMGQLIKAGLASAQRGSGGGASLARPADRITLRDVHRAVDGDAAVIPIHPAPNPKCPVGRNIQAALSNRIDAIDRAMQDEMARTTIADLFADVERRERRRRSSAAG